MKWNISGVLPPVEEGNETSNNRSPYKLNITDFVKDYCFNDQRRKILIGFLNFRKYLYEIGCTKGFQWVNGSFCEDCEQLRDRPPNDIDLVTFLDLSEVDINNIDVDLLTNNNHHKSQYNVDSYIMEVGLAADPVYIEQVTYWYGLWSHQKKTNIWKGFISIELSPEKDLEAMHILQSGLGE